jgi:hypothetical protein
MIRVRLESFESSGNLMQRYQQFGRPTHVTRSTVAKEALGARRSNGRAKPMQGDGVLLYGRGCREP